MMNDENFVFCCHASFRVEMPEPSANPTLVPSANFGEVVVKMSGLLTSVYLLIQRSLASSHLILLLLRLVDTPIL